MEFEWDEAKALSNLEKHGVRFSQAAEIFSDAGHTVLDAKPKDGETRLRAVGRVGEKMLTVIYTRRGPSIRLISARPAKRDERQAYGNG